ncbi:MAG: tRNA epoxyqueuosine(34) reductase QueG [Bdellovibrionota bacterium]
MDLSVTHEQQEQVSSILNQSGLTRHGWARLERPFSFDLYESWIEQGLQGQMEYLKRHSPIKAEPTQILPQAKSAIAVAFDYFPHPKPNAKHPLKSSRIALYARGEDYHIWLQKKLDDVCTKLSEEFPGEVFKASTDSAPVLERDLAARAGLGWVGKNTCLIDPKAGSLFFIGEILTSLVPDQIGTIHPDRCGTCTRCIDICPTQAIIEPRKLDARLCIPYLNIETKTPPPPELKKQIGDWMFGCDLCQTICPWNEKAFGKSTMQNEINPEASRNDLIKELKWILESEDKTLEFSLKDTPLLRRGAYGLKKNALIVAANKKISELRPILKRFTEALSEKDSKTRSEKDNWLLELALSSLQELN